MYIDSYLVYQRGGASGQKGKHLPDKVHSSNIMEKIFLFYTSLGKQLLSWQIVTVKLNWLWGRPTVVASLCRHCCCPWRGKKRAGAPTWQWFTWAKTPFWFSCSLPGSFLGPLSAAQVPTGMALLWYEQHCHQKNVHEDIHQKEDFFFPFCRKSTRRYLRRKFSFHETLRTNYYHFGVCILDLIRVLTLMKSGSGQSRTSFISVSPAQTVLFFSPSALFLLHRCPVLELQRKNWFCFLLALIVLSECLCIAEGQHAPACTNFK